MSWEYGLFFKHGHILQKTKQNKNNNNNNNKTHMGLLS